MSLLSNLSACFYNVYDYYIKLYNKDNVELNRVTDLYKKIAKIEDEESVGMFCRITSDSRYNCIRYLSFKDFIQFRGCSKGLSEKVSKENILVQRIYESFSVDFIQKLGCSRMLNILSADKLDSSLIPYINEPRSFNEIFASYTGTTLSALQLNPSLLQTINKLRSDDEIFVYPCPLSKKRYAFENMLKGFSIRWGKMTNNQLFFCFKINEDITRFYLVVSHPNSSLPWEQRAVRLLDRISNEPFNIYKVDDDHYSLTMELEEDLDTGLSIIDKTRTAFFKTFANVEN